MKIYIAIIMLSLLSLSSCTSFLDKLPENKSAANDVDYTKTSDMIKPVNGVYGQVASKISSWKTYGLISVRGDDVDKGSTAGDQLPFQQAKEFKYDQLTSFWALESSWEDLYGVVLNCNGALYSLSQYANNVSSASDIQLNKQYQAEVRFFRAYAYFMISRMWGDVPLLTDNDQVLANLTKTPRADVYAFIDSELDSCIANLPSKRPNQMDRPGAVTKFTALALKAKAAADVSNWNVVLSSTNEIINSGLFSLYPDYYTYFKKEGGLSDETLFELQYYKTASLDIGSDAWFDFQYPRGTIRRAAPSKGNETMDGGWGFLPPSQKMYDLLTSRNEGVRKQTIILPMSTADASGAITNYSVTQEGDTLDAASPGTPTFYDGKVYVPSTELPDKITSCGGNNSIRVIRYADVLLLNSEAEINLGQNGDASLNIVRSRAGMPALSGVTLDQVADERFVELGCEWGERFFDLVRTGKAASTLPGFVVGKSEYYPIPQQQINLNPNLAN